MTQIKILNLELNKIINEFDMNFEIFIHHSSCFRSFFIINNTFKTACRIQRTKINRQVLQIKLMTDQRNWRNE